VQRAVQPMQIDRLGRAANLIDAAAHGLLTEQGFEPNGRESVGQRDSQKEKQECMDRPFMVARQGLHVD
jgi:hypothetical protein